MSVALVHSLGSSALSEFCYYYEAANDDQKNLTHLLRLYEWVLLVKNFDLRFLRDQFESLPRGDSFFSQVPETQS